MFAANAFAPVEDILDIDESTQFTFEEVSPHSSVESELFELLDQVIRDGRLRKVREDGRENVFKSFCVQIMA